MRNRAGRLLAVALALARERLSRAPWSSGLPVVPQHDDLYLVEYPKSGITWLTFLLANYLCERNRVELDVNFFNINDFVPDIHYSRDIGPARFAYPGYRFIKSHSLFNPFYGKVIYVVRDPRDVLVSYYHFLTSLQQHRGMLSEFVRSETYGISAWRRHVESWMVESPAPSRLLLLRFEDMKRDSGLALSKLLKHLGCRIDPGGLARAVAKSSFETMRASEQERHEGDLRFSLRFSRFAFMRKGEVGTGMQELALSDIAYIDQHAGRWLEAFGYAPQGSESAIAHAVTADQRNEVARISR